MVAPYPVDLVPAQLGGEVVALVPRHRASQALAELVAELERLEEHDPVRDYLRQIGQTPLLSAQEERALARRIAAGRVAAAQFADDAEGTDAATRQALRAQVADGEAARAHLIEANLRLVVSVAKKYIGRGLSLLDLIQEGNIGLMRAVEKFDATKGHKFSTYATWWIRQGVTRALADDTRVVRLPVHMHDAVGRVRRCANQLHQEFGREPTPEEIGAALGLSAAKVARVLAASAFTLSLDRPVDETREESISLGMMVADDAPLPEEEVEQRMLAEELRAAVAKLPKRERRILELRYGLVDGQHRTLEEVGEEFGITRERIRQIEAEALRKLRHPHLGRALRGHLD